MRILHIIQRPQLRGAETFASQIAAIHRRQGHDVRFIALFPAASSQKLDLQGIDLVLLNGNEGSKFRDFTGWRKLGQLIKEYRPDIVQANAADTVMYGVYSRMLTGWNAPLVYRNANKSGDFINSRLKKVYYKWLVSKVDFVASVSQNCAEDFVEVYNYPKRRVRTMPIGTPIVRLPKRVQIRAELGLGLETPLLVNIGSFVTEKNHLGLLDILGQVLKRNDEVHLLLIGDGKLRSQLEEKVKLLEIANNVHFLGYRKDAVAILGECNVMVMPSFIEGLPGVILEAMVQGVPVVASDVGGIGEVIKHGKTGFLADPLADSSFVEPVLQLLANQELKQKIAERAFTFCSDNFNIELVADKFMEAYEELYVSK